MSVANKTPFSFLMFQSLDMAGDPFQVVVLKAAFDLSPTAPPVLSRFQDRVLTADEPWERGGPSSLKNEDDLAPFKTSTDVLITATAWAPGGKPAREWLASARVGKVEKRILVTGPRVWVHSAVGGWTLGAPEPVTSVPVRYERAYGGVSGSGDKAVAYRKNPVGKGYVDVASADKTRPIVAPNLLTPDFAPPVLGGDYPVEGLSALHKSWSPRLERAGTFDETWKKTRHPKVPEDFEFGFYNCAHPDLIYPDFIQGGEEVVLSRLHPDHEVLRFKLPANIVGVGLTDKVGYRYGGLARADTVHIDAERMKLHITYRATLPLFEDGVAGVRVELLRAEGASSAAAAEAS